MLRPTGYYILIEMEVVENKTESGIVIATNIENKREQGGHDVGIVRAFGPTVFKGFVGIDDEETKEVRAEQYGVEVGDRVEFNRYDGKVPRDPSLKMFRVIQDQHIVGVYE